MIYVVIKTEWKKFALGLEKGCSENNQSTVWNGVFMCIICVFLSVMNYFVLLWRTLKRVVCSKLSLFWNRGTERKKKDCRDFCWRKEKKRCGNLTTPFPSRKTGLRQTCSVASNTCQCRGLPQTSWRKEKELRITSGARARISWKLWWIRLRQKKRQEQRKCWIDTDKKCCC